jgi:hypothetical protein
MTINPTGRGGSIQLNTTDTTVRTAPRNDFATHVRTGIAVGANTTAGAVGVAAPFVPGAAVVSAAISGAGSAMTSGGAGGAGGAGGYGAASGGGGGTAFAGVGDLPMGGPGLNSNTNGAPPQGFNQQQLLDQTKNMQEMMASFNLQYLQLQEKMQAENRSFSSISNVMKTKHDTAKASIQNVR